MYVCMYIYIYIYIYIYTYIHTYIHIYIHISNYTKQYKITDVICFPNVLIYNRSQNLINITLAIRN